MLLPGAHIINSSDSKSSLYVDGLENISFKVSIKIVNSSNVRINGIGVHRGNATGLFLLQSHGNIAIVHSEFSKNRIDCFFMFNKANNTVKTEASNVKVLNNYY